MEKIIMLGVGHGATLDLYNTCFVIQNEGGNFLIDTGGSIEIVKRLNQMNIELSSIKDIFVSHSHTDHLLGLIWMFKRMATLKLDSNHKVNLYCNDVTYDAIIKVAEQVLAEGLIKKVFSNFNIQILTDGNKKIIHNIEYTFFDIRAKGPKQYGFECTLNNKKLVFLGDEPLNKELFDRVKNSDYVMHEAFCLDSEQDIFHPYEKNHSTAKSACEVMNELNVKNIILYHTEESHKEKRKELYIEEGKKYFNGNVLVPNDLEILELK